MKAIYSRSLDEQVHKRIRSGDNNFVVKTSKVLPLYVLSEYLCRPGSGYTISKVKPAEYLLNLKHKLSNQEAISYLKPLSPEGLKLVAINQCARKALFKSVGGDLVVYQYDTRPTKDNDNFYIFCTTAHYPSDISELFNYA